MCLAGVCAGTPVVCTALDQCHEAGVCDPTDGECTNPELDDGCDCDDEDDCTENDVCTAGSCSGVEMDCSAVDDCYDDGECEDGVCTTPELPDGTSCDDGDACTVDDECIYGACTPGTPIVCTAQDSCHEVGTCDSTTGECDNPVADDQTPCYDGDLCSLTDVCIEGVCTGTEFLICEALDDCHIAGECEAGVCTNPTVGDDSPCDDDNACTTIDVCLEGVCTGTVPVQCEAVDDCHDAGECDTETGVCSEPELDDETECDDGDLCTEDDCCYSGVCGGTTIECEAEDQCHLAGTCDSETGVCSNPEVDYDTPCDDGNACTLDDVCEYGACNGYDPVVCTAKDACHIAGVCDPNTGSCNNPTQTDGTPCSDRNACTEGDKCSKGACISGNNQCCHSPKGCGLCQPNCSGTNAQTVMTFFGLTTDKDQFVCNGGNVGKICPGANVCCSPDDQSKVYFSDSICTVPN